MSQTYSQIGNDAQVYKLLQKTSELRREKEMWLIIMLNRAIWQEIDYYEEFQADCVSDAAKYKSKIDNYDYSTSWQDSILNMIILKPRFLGEIHYRV